MSEEHNKEATLVRMVLPEYECPYGVMAKRLLEDQGYAIDEVILRTRSEVEEFKAKHVVATTPQIFINDKRIGGFTDLRTYFRAAA